MSTSQERLQQSGTDVYAADLLVQAASAEYQAALSRQLPSSLVEAARLKAVTQFECLLDAKARQVAAVRDVFRDGFGKR